MTFPARWADICNFGGRSKLMALIFKPGFPFRSAKIKTQGKILKTQGKKIKNSRKNIENSRKLGNTDFLVNCDLLSKFK